MSTMKLEIRNGLHILTLVNNENENRLTQDVLQEYLTAFDKVENYTGNTALLITNEDEKTFSTGINLDWLMKQDASKKSLFVKTLDRVFYRLALLNAPTVVCINGNTYGAGAVLVACTDFRTMRSDRGRLCYPEVNIKIPFTPVMIDIINLLPNKHALKHMALLCTAYTGQECKQSNLVDDIFPMETLQQQTLDIAKQLATKDRATYTSIKHGLRADIIKHKISDLVGINLTNSDILASL